MPTSHRTSSSPSRIIALMAVGCMINLLAGETAGGFVAFDQRAKQGLAFNIVFFGCSLTWGANASDQDHTSYRAKILEKLSQYYPKARFRCHDASIGGTNSQLGVFRVDRDALRWHPDLVFVDFTANDDIRSTDPESLASYEAILRRFASAGIPVVQVAFPFKWDTNPDKIPEMKRLADHRRLAAHYGNAFADAVTFIADGAKAGTFDCNSLWANDPIHPNDPGYAIFADVAWTAFLAGIDGKLVPVLPTENLSTGIYTNSQRFTLAGKQLPAGWSEGPPNLVSLYYDWLMSRWLDRLAIARNGIQADRKAGGTAAAPALPLRLKVSAQSIVLYGESTPSSATFRVIIDGKAVTGKGGQKEKSDLFDANRWQQGNGPLAFEVARDLDPAMEHDVIIEPVFSTTTPQELRLESICVAGGKATVSILK
jgi:lysophospholipase L1-like esterase